GDSGPTDRAAERRTDARDRPARRGERREAGPHRLEVAERRVVEEGVAAIEESRDAAGLDMPRDALGGVELQRAFWIAVSGQRRNGEDAVEISYVRRHTSAARSACPSPT